MRVEIVCAVHMFTVVGGCVSHTHPEGIAVELDH